MCGGACHARLSPPSHKGGDSSRSRRLFFFHGLAVLRFPWAPGGSCTPWAGLSESALFAFVTLCGASLECHTLGCFACLSCLLACLLVCLPVLHVCCLRWCYRFSVVDLYVYRNFCQRLTIDSLDYVNLALFAICVLSTFHNCFA